MVDSTLVALGITSGIIGSAIILKGPIKDLFLSLGENLKPTPPTPEITVEFKSPVEIKNTDINFSTPIEIHTYSMPRKRDKNPKPEIKEYLL